MSDLGDAIEREQAEVAVCRGVAGDIACDVSVYDVSGRRGTEGVVLPGRERVPLQVSVWRRCGVALPMLLPVGFRTHLDPRNTDYFVLCRDSPLSCCCGAPLCQCGVRCMKVRYQGRVRRDEGLLAARALRARLRAGGLWPCSCRLDRGVRVRVPCP